jgi:hypothetical protein
MPKYTMELNAVVGGLDTIIIDVPEDYSIGQSVTISPTSDMAIYNRNGISVVLTPGVPIIGTITDRS